MEQVSAIMKTDRNRGTTPVPGVSADVLVAPVGSYDDRDGIQRFVANSLEADPEIAAMLRAADPGRLVVVKPNWIQESHEHRAGVWEPVITHPRILLAIVETLASYMDGRGTICICDAPHTYADFSAITTRGDLKDGIEALRRRWPVLRIEQLDLRREIWVRKEEVIVERHPNPEDPRGYTKFDLAKDSLFYDHKGQGSYYGADYDTTVVNRHHRGEVQEYLLAGSPMACDLFLNVPKLKTHKKTGITCALKNLVGINGDKNWLPHHTEGTPDCRGDEFPAPSFSRLIESHLKKVGQRGALAVPGLGTWVYRKARNLGKRVLGDSETVIRNGNWSGNDTCWRMALDLNRCLLYGNRDGTWREAGARKHYLAIADGILGGQGNGPLTPDPARAGVLVSSTNPAALDAAAAGLMGFPLEALPIVTRAFDDHRWPIADRRIDDVVVDDARTGRILGLHELAPAVPGGFTPHFGWSVLRESA